jgi:trans-AT polyketide synthase/acyltransferase/oxidoreductase domain-containing protein
VPNRVLAKISRPETATMFMRPPPTQLVRRLIEKGALSAAEAELAAHIPVADDLCVEADSGGHTDRGRAIVIVPAICHLARGNR